MGNLAIITARGGSKRIPRKNIKDFCGKPILAYSIEAALESGLFEEVMVSTDDQEIAEIARKYGAKVPFMRSEATSNDFAGTSDVLQEVVREYEKRGKEFEYMCCIYPCAPFVTAQKLRDSMQMLLDKGGDSIYPVVRYSYPPQRACVLRDGQMVYQFPEYASYRSQDLEPIFHDAGQYYLYRMSSFWGKEGPRVGLYIEMPDTQVQDIDNYEDWEIAELKYQLMIKRMAQQ